MLHLHTWLSLARSGLTSCRSNGARIHHPGIHLLTLNTKRLTRTLHVGCEGPRFATIFQTQAERIHFTFFFLHLFIFSFVLKLRALIRVSAFSGGEPIRGLSSKLIKHWQKEARAAVDKSPAVLNMDAPICKSFFLVVYLFIYFPYCLTLTDVNAAQTSDGENKQVAVWVAVLCYYTVLFLCAVKHTFPLEGSSEHTWSVQRCRPILTTAPGEQLRIISLYCS